jgi:hypothetical protein
MYLSVENIGRILKIFECRLSVINLSVSLIFESVEFPTTYEAQIYFYHIYQKRLILSRVLVTIDVVRIGNWIY